MRPEQLEGMSKAALIELHRQLFGNVGDSGRTSKAEYVQRIQASASAEQLAAVNESAVVSAAAASTSGRDAGEQLIEAVRALAGNSINEDRVRAIVAESVKAAVENLALPSARELRIVAPDGTRTVTGASHEKLADLIRVTAAVGRVWLTGPTGSGKTHAAEQVAEAIGAKFFFNGAIDTEYKLSGFVDASGKIVETAFTQAVMLAASGQKALYLFDEVDASLPNATIAFNAALSNNMLDLPGRGMVRIPSTLYIMAAANTWGFGATHDYVGRYKMDAAFRKRFVAFEWPYDEQLEAALAGNKEWTALVQRARRKAQENGLKVVICPRDAIYGARLIAAGFSQHDAVNMTFGAGLTAEQRAALDLGA